ncbi:Hypothetical predicted protein [Mytilus galloprovincialis]|uniref:Uncharacterized protein n=1 Tax=Mytilus galloprovincialis TaxID=29158 RepID=A0A8B6CG37_MYTGA|nr:Hypothetical predicted protein [Mytilus galloprovincialis]
MENSESEETIPNTRREEQQTAKDVAESTLGLFKDYFDSQIGSLKRELKEEAASKSDKFSGNKLQFEFNSDIDHELSRIKRATESRDYDKIKDICYDLKDKLHKRNKCIKIADKSPAGWGTVKEYLSDELASDTDDERRIRSAETRALKAKKNFEQDRNKRKIANSYGSKMLEDSRTTSALVTRTWVIGEETAQSSTSQQVPDKDTNDKYYFDFVDNDKSELKEQLNTLQLDSYEYEQSVTVQSVKGRLKKHLDYWKKIEANSYVLDIIENGYAIPFITTPDSVFSKNNKSAIDNAEFVSQAIAELLVNDCIEEVKTRPHVINPLTVSTQKSGKKRLILDFKGS